MRKPVSPWGSLTNSSPEDNVSLSKSPGKYEEDLGVGKRDALRVSACNLITSTGKRRRNRNE
jgi:hypothetical protein